MRSSHIKYICEECDYENVNEATLRKHKEDKHSNIEEYECNSGDFRTNTNDSIPIHIKEKTHSYCIPYLLEVCF